MAIEGDPLWDAVIAAEDEFGEGAEEHARREAAKASECGDMALAEKWGAIADMLHTLHAINRQWARPRAAPAPAPRSLAKRDERKGDG